MLPQVRESTRTLFGEVTNQSVQGSIQKLAGVNKSQIPQGKGHILFHVVWNASQPFILKFTEGLCQEMCIIGPQVMKNDWNVK